MTETPPAPDVDPSGLRENSRGLWVIPDRRVPLVPNIGIVEGDDAVLVVDVGMGPVNGGRVLEEARKRAAGRKLHVTVTHFHPEHGYGLQVFRGEAHSVYNRAQLDELHDKGPGYLEMFRTFGPGVAAALEGVELVDPDETYDGPSHELDLGGRTVQLLTWGRAHTRSDQVVFVPDVGVLFAGDLVEERIFAIYPYFPPEDADVDGDLWIGVLAKLRELRPQIVVPGHGDVSGPNLLQTVQDYHELIAAKTREAVADGCDADEAVARIEPLVRDRYPDWEAPEWIGFAVRSFFAKASG
jgi:glyoxylase-like metal-dependent hydrolase (beta-lactamase superfamily II)